jgi:glycine betaine/proline transport system ATP-binding protein
VQYGRPLDIVMSPANDYVRDYIRGIDVFKVLSAGQIVDTARPPVVLAPGTVTSLPLVRASAGPVAVTNPDGRLLGVVERPAGLGLAPSDWEKALTQDFIRLAPEQLIAPFLDELSRNQRPIVVVREDGTLVGMVTGGSVLKALATNSEKTKSEAAVLEPQIAIGADQKVG